MIINFPNLRARRITLVAILPESKNAIARRPARLVCRWVADPAGGPLRAVWEYPAAGDKTAACQSDFDRIRLVA